MKIASVADVKANFSSYIRESEEGAVVITRNGKPVAVLLGVQDDDEVERLILSRSRRLKAILDAAHQRIRAGEGIPHDEFWEQVEAESAEPREPEKSEPKPKARGRKPRKS
jgi:prevent-host-death family protein